MLNQNARAIDYIINNPQQILLDCPNLSNRKLNQNRDFAIYYYRSHPAHLIPIHYHPHHALQLNLSATARLKMNFLENRLQQTMALGGIAITPVDVEHQGSIEKGTEFLTIGLNPAFVACSACESIDPDCVELVPTIALSDPLIYQIGMALKTELEKNDGGDRLYSESAIHFLAVHLLKRYSRQKHHLPEYEGGLSKYKLRSVMDYIDEHLEQELSIAKLAQLVHMSSYYFMRLFKQSTGLTPHSYITQQRLEKAKHLLVGTNLSILEIADCAGFGSQSRFSTVFRQHLKVSPKSYREQAQ